MNLKTFLIISKEHKPPDISEYRWRAMIDQYTSGRIDGWLYDLEKQKQNDYIELCERFGIKN